MAIDSTKLDFRGTPLTSEDFKKGKVVTSTGDPHAEYAWDAGSAIGTYLEGLRQGKLLGSRCRRCSRKMIPPRDFCELCYRPVHETVTLKDTGIVNTFSLCYVTWDMQKLKTPQIPAVIEIDGAGKGMGIMHLLGEVDPTKVKIGMKVRAVWKPESERTGSILDIRHFKPAG